MVSSVTVTGAHNTPITLSFDATANSALAQQIAARINSQLAAGKLTEAYDTSGPPASPKHGTTGVYVQGSSTFAVLPGTYTADLVTKTGQAIVFGSGAKDEMILSSIKTDLTFIGLSGAGTVVAGGGNDRVLTSGSGSWSINTADGNDFIAAMGSGNDTVSAGGGHNAIILGSGKDMVISNGDDTVTAGTGAETIDASGSHSIFVQGEKSDLLFFGGQNGATIVGGQGSDTYFGASGNVGKQLVIGGSEGHNVLIAGNGPATLVGGGTGDQLFAMGDAKQVLIAGSGAETLSGIASSGNTTLIGGSGHDLLIGGTGKDTFRAGSGQETIQAGYGKNLFEFVKQAGESDSKTLVTGIFDPKDIKIDLDGYGPHEVAYALSHQTAHNGSVTVSLTDGTKVTFQDVTSLKASNFS